MANTTSTWQYVVDTGSTWRLLPRKISSIYCRVSYGMAVTGIPWLVLRNTWHYVIIRYSYGELPKFVLVAHRRLYARCDHGITMFQVPPQLYGSRTSLVIGPRKWLWVMFNPRVQSIVRILNRGAPQWCVLSLVLFSLDTPVIVDFPQTSVASSKYADDHDRHYWLCDNMEPYKLSVKRNLSHLQSDIHWNPQLHQNYSYLDTD